MKKLFFLLAALYSININAQNYLISFSASGALSSVATVSVENLNSGATLSLNGSDILRLSISTGVNSIDYNQTTGIKIYPNPMNESATFEVSAPVPGDIVVSVIETSGKTIAQKKLHLESIKQAYRISGLSQGAYIVNVKGSGFNLSGVLVSNGSENKAFSIESVNNINRISQTEAVKRETRGSEATVDMAYSAGDRLKFTGASGSYKTVLTDIPASNKTINFNFVACTDGDLNIYPVVVIGTQTWMAENLKTTKYNDGTAIPNVTVNATWSTLSTGAYADYSNTPAVGAIYGKLYNWYVVAPTNTKKICPSGWHVPTDAQWTVLNNYLGGEALAGGKMKETGTTHWLSPNAASNESGFTALPGGYRDQSGSFSFFNYYGFWWASTEVSAGFAYYRFIYNTNTSLSAGDNDKHGGFYVRCMKD
jgi:uncharacterized protein (TIGR02145 family)